MFEKMCDHSSGWRPGDGAPDLAMMSDITAEGINTNLRTRYLRDEIYTFSGSILIAVNPYKQLDIYNNKWIARYRQQRLNQNDPHIFALTEAMYMNLVMQSADTPTHNNKDPDLIRQQATISKLSSLSSQPEASQNLLFNVSSVKNQACVISGESGAGKTETTKFILSYLCAVTPNKSIWMEHQILEANTILEAFGNAKTVRNDNSSRFGKFIQICFDSRHQITGCIIQDYLLEQSRITYQSVGERNYHVFYQLLAAGQFNEELRKKFHLMPPHFYEYLNKTNCYNIDGIDDCAMFDSLRTAMSVLNMSQDSSDGLFSILSTVLWLGNLQFKCDDTGDISMEKCRFTEADGKIIEVISQLLGIERPKLESILLKRQIIVRGSVTEIPFKLHEARDNRNAMAKALYSRLFTWVVNFINASTNPGADNTCFLGVLDIFGFENFDTNSFEQLCINYANEKLHKFFNQHMFAMEQELYKREGIEFCDINYTDNTPCLELLERPPNCILRLLSEECRMPKGNDATLIEKLHTEFTIINPNPFYAKGNDRRNWSCEFSVRHFAGSVTYNVDGFLKKNRDAQQGQLIDIIGTSTNPLLQDIVQCERTRDMFHQTSEGNTISRSSNMRKTSLDFQFRLPAQSVCEEQKINFKSRLMGQQSFCNATSTISEKPQIGLQRELSFSFESQRQPNYASNSTKSRPTVADAFRYQLVTLVDLLSKVNPWYVRCIKPNLEKSATSFDNRQVLMQLRYLGMSDLIRIRREGYPIHLTKHQFVCRYRCLMIKHLKTNPSYSPIGLDESVLHSCCLRMINHFKLSQQDWKIGKTMVLLRSVAYQPLEEWRNESFTNSATKIQSFWRGNVQRRKYTKLRNAAMRIQETFRAYRGRLFYLRKKRAVLTIQAYCRGMFAREIANAMREIKHAEQEKTKRAQEEERLREQEQELKRLKLQDQCFEPDVNNNDTQIVITDAPDIVDEPSTNNQNNGCLVDESHSPLSNVSPIVSSSASWIGQDVSEARQKLINARDKKEMEELVKVLESHGISLDALEQCDKKVYADFERLYDVLGTQLHTSCDTHSISPSVNEDDGCSFATTGTNCDGDSISCSGQSQISSTITDVQTVNNEREVSQECSSQDYESECNETVNNNQDAEMYHDDNYHSNSVESIASIVSSASMNAQAPSTTQNNAENISRPVDTPYIAPGPQINRVCDIQSAIRTSTFTGNSVVLGGSKMVSNGRPLTRIEEEPNSITSTPSKAASKLTAFKLQGLFPPQEDEMMRDQNLDIKRRRIERRILQVQQNQNQLPINTTTDVIIGDLTSCPKGAKENPSRSGEEQDSTIFDSVDADVIYGAQKTNILEYAERTFNSHPRDSISGSTMMRTLTRRRRSVDTTANEFLTKAEMLSYNSSFTIPTSHIKMHDPHNAQISCSIFKNLCKYMTGDSAKSDNEVRILQSIVRHGIEKSELRDEIYIQIIRQLTNNSNNEYCLRLWILLGLVSASFSPSKSFSKHIFDYLKSKPRKDPSITCHAQFCLDNLQAPRLGPRKLPPSPLEIQACKSLSNLTCKIHLLDGRCEILSIHPCDTAIDTQTKLAHKLNLQSIEGWAIYESYTSGASKYPHPTYEQRGDFERTIKSSSFMADLIASWQEGIPKNSNVPLKVVQKRLDEGSFKLTFKKKIFRGPKIRNDPVEISLLYAQAVFNVVKKDCFFVDENLALSLAGLQAQIALGNVSDALKISDGPSRRGKVVKTRKTAVKTPVQIYDFENFICLRLRNQISRSKKDWCNLIYQTHKQFHNVNEVFCKMRYLSMVIYHCPLYGTATFDVTYKGYQALDQNLLLGINAEGLVLIRSSDKALIKAYRYNDICPQKGVTVYLEERIIQINVKDRSDCSINCLTFESNENEEIASLMMSYSPALQIHIRAPSELNNYILDINLDQSSVKKKAKLKMTLEDRMRTHQEVQNSRRSIIRSGKLRKPAFEEQNTGLLKHTIRKLSSSKSKNEKHTRFENIYGTLGRVSNQKPQIPQASSDYNISNSSCSYEIDTEYPLTEVAGATAATTIDELTKTYPHRYWAYTRYPIRNSLLTIYDPDLEEAALVIFNGILIYSGLLNQAPTNGESGSSASTLDSSSIDSGIASQQSLSNTNGKNSNASPSSISSSDIYDVCPKKLDEREIIKLAQGILDRCLKKGADILKNEFFLQLIKQTTDHPDPNSEINKRHWQLLALACSVTYPSDTRILSYLYAHLRRCSLDQISNEGQYAQFTLRSLQGTLDTKGRKYAPSEIEVLSTINCRRVYARVYFLDGQFQAVEFDPCATIAEVVDQIKQKIGLRQECTGYALFQPLDDDCEQVLKPEEKVGDAISSWEAWQKQKQFRDNRQKQISNSQQMSLTNGGANSVNKASIASLNANTKTKTHKFVFKKYLFSDNLMDLNDPVERELLYHQTVASIKEDKFPILEQEATILCALKAQIEIGDYTKLSNLPREHIRMVYKQVVMSLMPPHAFNNLQVQTIAQQHQAFKDLNRIDTKKYFFNLIQSFGRANFPSNPGCVLLHRSHVYNAKQTFATAWPSDIWVVVNYSGFHMLVSGSRRVLASCEYRQIVDYNSNNDNLMVIASASAQSRVKYTFYSKQAQQITQQMKDYIVINTSSGNKHRKSVGFNLR